ncbi:inorganic phosphate transporter [Lacihabitans sp. LS3-19]|uniref:inorganic phosphate transporter n=1 Tax=Lacihabitans sp. LS3-19 TaxID=2487335 RepID=UPI0020CFB77E|nr:inorganic phosphate transporter [Lacihabitans sp. LS3-19]MCP9767569.1 inorganic phosphate transporter [Lacihabitans sp. LS3-19]
MFGLETDIFILLFIALLAACVFEFINGFHDTANAVATVIYTNSLKPTQAVVYSGLLNFIGVITGGVGVGMSIVNLLPVELLIDQNVYHSVSMVMAMLLSAIIWNFGTWYFGLPSSSSHTLIGAIMGVGLGYALLPENATGAAAINWDKVKDIFTGLIMAPLIGFTLAVVLMFILRKTVSKDVRNQIFSEPKKNVAPPNWIRGTLISTCGLVSFFHGRNDGQKGIGLMMLILIGILPSYFAITSAKELKTIQPDLQKIEQIVSKIDTVALGISEKKHISEIRSNIAFLMPVVNQSSNDTSSKMELRGAILKIASNTKKLLNDESVSMSQEDREQLTVLAVKEEKGIRKATDFAPFWVIMLISLSLGLGTMIGWKRIVVTVGEKIGKSHLTYAQGASAEIVAAITIGLASGFKLPVSTTHTLSSGIAGSMVASKGIKNLQSGTIKNIAIAWVLTLPVSMTLSAVLFLLFRFLID